MVENHQPAQIPPVRYIVRFPERSSHYLSIEANFVTHAIGELEVFLPVWTPGSYLVREYARNIEAISATGSAGEPLPCCKSRKNRWRILTNGASEVRVSYKVYCREMSVRTNWVEDSFALLNGAPTFVAVAAYLGQPHEVHLELPPDWTKAVTGLAEISPGGHRYLAPDYDTLADSPILCGNPAIYQFEVDGLPHVLANEGEHGVWDGPRSVADTEKLVRQHRQFWGSLPYRKYVILNILNEASGGLEHANSVCLMASRWATRTRRNYLRWLNLVSHEFFHVWNAKRLRPVELGPFDYENENYTRSLWIAEGITEYYAPLTTRRAGLCTPAEYLESLSDAIRVLQTTPGRLEQSLEQSSFDAWIKLYRPDENSINSTISYYTKGTVAAWLLDARIRRGAGNAKSLDDVMQAAFERYSGERGFSPEEFKSIASEIAGAPLDAFFRRTVESTEEFDYSEALDWFGLRFKQLEKSGCAPAIGLPAIGMPIIGITTRTDNGRLLVTRIPRDTPAAGSGLMVDDEILAIDNFRVRPDQLSQRLECYKPGDQISILVSRREVLTRVEVTLGVEPAVWQLEILPDQNRTQEENFRGWLGL